MSNVSARCRLGVPCPWARSQDSGADASMTVGADAGVWTHADMPRMWHRAMYDEETAAPVMRELFAAQMVMLEGAAAGAPIDECVAAARDAAAARAASPASGLPASPRFLEREGSLSTFVEVGCGTSEAGAELLARGVAKWYVGLDLSQVFLTLSAALHPILANREVAALVQGDASHLESEVHGAGATTPLVHEGEAEGTPVPTMMDEDGTALAKSSPSAAVRAATLPCLVACVMNTMGILPDCIREQVVKEMIRTAKPGGAVVVGCWCAGSFAEGVERFYKRHPELCGTITDDMVDLESATLVNPDGPSGTYSSQWWTHERVKSLFPSTLRQRVTTVSVSVGVFAILRVDESAVACAM